MLGSVDVFPMGKPCKNCNGKLLKSPCTLCSAVAYCCGAVAPRAIAALLGRFLPRLGPLVHSSGPFFFSGVIPDFVLRHSGAMRSIEPGNSRFRVRFAPRND